MRAPPGQECPDFEWSGFQMVGTIAKAQPFENWTLWNATFKKSQFQIVGFQIHTVLVFLKYSRDPNTKHSNKRTSNWKFGIQAVAWKANEKFVS